MFTFAKLVNKHFTTFSWSSFEMTRAGWPFGFLLYAWTLSTQHGTFLNTPSLVQKGLDVTVGRSPPTSSSASQTIIFGQARFRVLVDEGGHDVLDRVLGGVRRVPFRSGQVQQGEDDDLVVPE